jgi:transposase
MQRERVRIIQRLRSLFYESGVRVRTSRSAPHRVPLSRLTAPGAEYVARAYLRQLEVATSIVANAREMLLEQASRHCGFHLLQTVPFIGEVRAAELVGVIGEPSRFPSVRAFWSYAGLAVVQRVSAEHRVEKGKIVREQRMRGGRLSRSAQPLLKKIIRDIALHSSIRKGYFRDVFESHLARGKTPAVARLALARKVAAIIFAVWRNGSPYRRPTT